MKYLANLFRDPKKPSPFGPGDYYLSVENYEGPGSIKVTCLHEDKNRNEVIPLWRRDINRNIENKNWCWVDDIPESFKP